MAIPNEVLGNVKIVLDPIFSGSYEIQLSDMPSIRGWNSDLRYAAGARNPLSQT